MKTIVITGEERHIDNIIRESRGRVDRGLIKIDVSGDETPKDKSKGSGRRNEKGGDKAKPKGPKTVKAKPEKDTKVPDSKTPPKPDSKDVKTTDSKDVNPKG